MIGARPASLQLHRFESAHAAWRLAAGESPGGAFFLALDW